MTKIAKETPLILVLALIALILLAYPRLENQVEKIIMQDMQPLPAVGQWNGFLDHMNVVECTTLGAGSRSLELELYSSRRESFKKHNLGLSNWNSVHQVLNDAALVDNYGSYQLSSSETIEKPPVSCHTMLYRRFGGGADYSYALPLSAPLKGDSYGIYNSYHPSGPSFPPVSNWLSVVNEGSSPFSATLKIFSQTGERLPGKELRIESLPPGAKTDIALGHPDGMLVGMYLIAPDDSSSKYQAHLTRYGQDRSGNYIFAFPLSASYGSRTPETLFASTMNNALNWGVVGNLGPQAEEVMIRVYSREKEVLWEEKLSIPAFSQQHFFLNKYIGQENVGLFEVKGVSENARLHSQSFYYGQDSTVGKGLAWAYASQALELERDAKPVSFAVNTFGNASNWLKLANLTDTTQIFRLQIHDVAGNLHETKYAEFALDGTIDIPLHEEFGPDSIGSVQLESISGSKYTAKFVRAYVDSTNKLTTITDIPGSGLSTLRAYPRGLDSDQLGDGKKSNDFVLGSGEEVSVSVYDYNPNNADSYKHPIFKYADLVNRAYQHKLAHPSDIVKVKIALYQISKDVYVGINPNEISNHPNSYGWVNGDDFAGEDSEDLLAAIYKAANAGVRMQLIYHNPKGEGGIQEFFGDKAKQYTKHTDWGPVSNDQMHNKFVTIQIERKDSSGNYHDFRHAVYVSTANADSFKTNFTPNFKASQIGVFVRGNSGLTNAYSNYFDLIWNNADNISDFRNEIRNRHKGGTLNYRDEHFQAYFFPISNKPADYPEGVLVERDDARGITGDDVTAGWIEKYNPVTAMVNELRRTDGPRYIKFNEHWCGSINPEFFTTRLSAELGDLYRNQGSSLLDIRSAIYNPASEGVRAACPIEPFALQVMDGQVPLGGLTAAKVRTHEKNIQFAFGKTKRYYSMTGSANLNKNEYLSKANNMLVILETNSEHPVYSLFKDQFYRLF